MRSAICSDAEMPAKAAVYRWLAGNQEFRRVHAVAHSETSAQVLAICGIAERAVGGVGDVGEVELILASEAGDRSRKIRRFGWLWKRCKRGGVVAARERVDRRADVSKSEADHE